ncbi:MAG: MCP four helix bundle domain-containing protein, partial [Pseudomonadota bacterium]
MDKSADEQEQVATHHPIVGGSNVFGVRGRLLLAFLAISAFVVIAAGSGIVSLFQVGDALTRVTEERVPQAIAWLEISRQAERIVHAAPTLLIVDSQPERQEVAESIALEVDRLEQQLEVIEATSERAEELVALRIRPMVDGLDANLISVDGLIQERLEIAARKSDLLRRLSSNTRTAQRLVEPGVLLVNSKLLEWDRVAGAGEGDLTAEEA